VCWRRGSVRKWQIFSGCVFSNSSALELVSPKLPTPPLRNKTCLSYKYELDYILYRQNLSRIFLLNKRTNMDLQ